MLDFTRFKKESDKRLMIILASVGIRKVGNSRVITLPAQVRSVLGLKDSDRIKYVRSQGKIYIEKEGA